MTAAGISSSDFGYVDYIVSHESGWCPTKWNGEHDCPTIPTANIWGSGAYGLGQALGPGKMAPFGADYMLNPITQLKWANGYSEDRYGGWANSYYFWLQHSYW